MNRLPETELKARVRAIESGPWTRRARLASAKLSLPSNPVYRQLIAKPNLNLKLIPLNRKTRLQVRELSEILRWHGGGASPNQEEQEIRSSFDEALTYFQLIELAIETGYLPQEQLDPAIRTKLIRLCWSEPARRFLRDYEYSSVQALGARLGLAGFSEQTVDSVDPSGVVYFASFLATHRALELDRSCNAWLDFLDDYVVMPQEQNKFYEFLKKGTIPRTPRQETLLTGAHRFMLMLADFLEPLPPSLKVRFGGFYQYWLSRMYGYVRKKSGFSRNHKIWGDHESWITSLQGWFSLRAKDNLGATEELIVKVTFTEAVETVTPTWNAIRSTERPAGPRT